MNKDRSSKEVKIINSQFELKKLANLRKNIEFKEKKANEKISSLKREIMFEKINSILFIEEISKLNFEIKWCSTLPGLQADYENDSIYLMDTDKEKQIYFKDKVWFVKPYRNELYLYSNSWKELIKFTKKNNLKISLLKTNELISDLESELKIYKNVRSKFVKNGFNV